MPAAAPIAYATVSSPLQSKAYITGITRLSSGHLLLSHPSTSLSIADAQTLQQVGELRGGHTQDVVAARSDDGVWSAGKDGNVVRWDERARSVSTTIKAFVRKPLPVLSLAVSTRDNLVIAGTELVGAEAFVLFWDIRNAKQPVAAHASTHSDDITTLELMPSIPGPGPERLLLSGSTDGLVSLTDIKETDEDEAVYGAENWGVSIANAGVYRARNGIKVWARSDMDQVATWDVGRSAEGDLEFQSLSLHETEVFKKTFKPQGQGPSITQTAEDERQSKAAVDTDYVIDVVPSLGVSKRGQPMTAVGTNDGDIILLHQSSSYEPSAFFKTGPGARGHKDVVRSLLHDVENTALYTGSEDGVLSGWSLAGLSLLVGDPDLDDDGGDGREDIPSDSDESEIVTEEEEEDDKDDDDMDVDEGPRSGPTLGGGTGAERRNRSKHRVGPY